MIKSIQNDQKNISKDQNQENGEIGGFFSKWYHEEWKKQVKSFR